MKKDGHGSKRLIVEWDVLTDILVRARVAYMLFLQGSSPTLSSNPRNGNY